MSEKAETFLNLCKKIITLRMDIAVHIAEGRDLWYSEDGLTEDECKALDDIAVQAGV
jgi:hypothetical protein